MAAPEAATTASAHCPEAPIRQAPLRESAEDVGGFPAGFATCSSGLCGLGQTPSLSGLGFPICQVGGGTGPTRFGDGSLWASRVQMPGPPLLSGPCSRPPPPEPPVHEDPAPRLSTGPPRTGQPSRPVCSHAQGPRLICPVLSSLAPQAVPWGRYTVGILPGPTSPCKRAPGPRLLSPLGWLAALPASQGTFPRPTARRLPGQGAGFAAGVPPCALQDSPFGRGQGPQQPAATWGQEGSP